MHVDAWAGLILPASLLGVSMTKGREPISRRRKEQIHALTARARDIAGPHTSGSVLNWNLLKRAIRRHLSRVSHRVQPTLWLAMPWARIGRDTNPVSRWEQQGEHDEA
jgi:hypothetical protein